MLCPLHQCYGITLVQLAVQDCAVHVLHQSSPNCGQIWHVKITQLGAVVVEAFCCVPQPLLLPLFSETCAGQLLLPRNGAQSPKLLFLIEDPYFQADMAGVLSCINFACSFGNGSLAQDLQVFLNYFQKISVEWKFVHSPWTLRSLNA